MPKNMLFLLLKMKKYWALWLRIQTPYLRRLGALTLPPASQHLVVR